MKLTLFFLLSFLIQNSFASEFNFNQVNPLEYYTLDMNKNIQKVPKDFKEKRPKNYFQDESENSFYQELKRSLRPIKIMINYDGKPVRVFGLSEKEVLNMIGDQNGKACSSMHEQGDLGNRWCHAYVVKKISENLKQNGINPYMADLIGASFFIPK